MDTKDIVISAFEKSVNRKVTPEMEMFEAITDSISFAEICAELEKTYPGITNDMFDADTIQDAIDMCKLREPKI